MVAVQYLGGPRNGMTQRFDDPPARIALDETRTYVLAGDGHTYTLHIASPAPVDDQPAASTEDDEHIRPRQVDDQATQVRPAERPATEQARPRRPRTRRSD